MYWEVEEATITEVDEVELDQRLEMQVLVEARRGFEESVQVARTEDKLIIEAQAPKPPADLSY